MRKILNVIIIFIILLLGNQIAPEYIIIENWKPALIATLIILCLNIVVGILMFVNGLIITALPLTFETKFWTILISAILSIFVAEPLGLYLSNLYVSGFALQGIHTYLILSILISIFEIEDKSEEKSTTR